jgi:hypothetical protein
LLGIFAWHWDAFSLFILTMASSKKSTLNFVVELAIQIPEFMKFE